jgi:hypothetical protein
MSARGYSQSHVGIDRLAAQYDQSFLSLRVRPPLRSLEFSRRLRLLSAPIPSCVPSPLWYRSWPTQISIPTRPVYPLPIVVLLCLCVHETVPPV